jgi:hypothetical protein
VDALPAEAIQRIRNRDLPSVKGVKERSPSQVQGNQPSSGSSRPVAMRGRDLDDLKRRGNGTRRLLATSGRRKVPQRRWETEHRPIAGKVALEMFVPRTAPKEPFSQIDLFRLGHRDDRLESRGDRRCSSMHPCVRGTNCLTGSGKSGLFFELFLPV